MDEGRAHADLLVGVGGAPHEVGVRLDIGRVPGGLAVLGSIRLLLGEGRLLLERGVGGVEVGEEVIAESLTDLLFDPGLLGFLLFIYNNYIFLAFVQRPLPARLRVPLGALEPRETSFLRERDLVERHAGSSATRSQQLLVRKAIFRLFVVI